MPSKKKIIGVFGATGHQGSGLVRAILNEGEESEFTVRAFVRHPESERARYLKNRPNVDVCVATLNNEDTIRKALDGVYGVYCVTFFWENSNPEEELIHAKRMASAAKAAGVKHVIWSTFEDSRKMFAEPAAVETLISRWKVPQCDAKGEADEYFAALPTTYLLTSSYWDNFIDEGLGPKKTGPGKWTLNLPLGEHRLAGIASEDIGKCALGIFKRPNDYINKRVGIMGEALSGHEMAEKMARVLNRSVEYTPVKLDEYRKEKHPRVKEYANMFQLFQECEDKLLAARSIEEARLLNPELMNFDQWLAKYKSFIPVSIPGEQPGSL